VKLPESPPHPLLAAYLACCVALILPAVVDAREPALLLTGEVYSRKAQEIIVPLTTNWQARISKMLEEGAAAKPGDVVVEFDGAEAASQLEQNRETARAELAKTERDLAKLEKEFLQASFALEMAELTLELAELKAETPEGLIGAIEYAENQLALESAKKALEDTIVIQEEIQEIICTIQDLPEKHKYAVLLHDFHELSYSEAAQVMNVPQPHFKVLLFRGRQAIRKRKAGEK